MAGRLPPWLRYWLLVSTPIVLWDAFFVLLRPDSQWGAISPLWYPYTHKYTLVDKRYADLDDGFGIAQSMWNLVECGGNLWAVSLDRAADARAPVVALLALASAFVKTCLYFLTEAFGGLPYTGHNTAADFFLVFVLPSSLWIVLPLAGVWAIGEELVDAVESRSPQKRAPRKRV